MNILRYNTFIVESTDSKTMEEVFSPHINWNEINDIVDMASEYFDSGLTLRIRVIYIEKENYNYITVSLFIYSKSSDSDTERLPSPSQSAIKPLLKNTIENPSLYDLQPIDPNLLGYELWVTGHDRSVSEDDCKKETKELIQRVKNAFPDRIIKEWFEMSFTQVKKWGTWE